MNGLSRLLNTFCAWFVKWPRDVTERISVETTCSTGRWLVAGVGCHADPVAAWSVPIISPLRALILREPFHAEDAAAITQRTVSPAVSDSDREGGSGTVEDGLDGVFRLLSSEPVMQAHDELPDDVSVRRPSPFAQEDGMFRAAAARFTAFQLSARLHICLVKLLYARPLP